MPVAHVGNSLVGKRVTIVFGRGVDALKGTIKDDQTGRLVLETTRSTYIIRDFLYIRVEDR